MLTEASKEASGEGVRGAEQGWADVVVVHTLTSALGRQKQEALRVRG